MTKSDGRAKGWRQVRLAALALAAVLPAACTSVAPEAPSNPFVGSWMTGERNPIAFRDTTVIVNGPNGAPTPMSPATCSRAFRFGYTRKSRESLIALAPRQPELRRSLGALLIRPDYPVAELACDSGGTTYVMLDDRNLVAIYRDYDIAGLQRLRRL